MSAAAATSGARKPEGLASRGRVGMLALILSECAFFGVFLVAYLYYEGRSPTGPTPGEVLSFPVLGTLALLSSSVTIVRAVRELREGRAARFAMALLVTIGLGMAFLGLTALEWRELILGDGLTIGTNLFGTTFYSLVGFHATHVTVGVAMMSTVAALALRGHVGAAHAAHVELLSWYWHFVDAVWIAVLLVVYVETI